LKTVERQCGDGTFLCEPLMRAARRPRITRGLRAAARWTDRRKLDPHAPVRNKEAPGQCRDALDACRDVSGKSTDAFAQCMGALARNRDVFEPCMDALAQCRDVSAATRALDPQSKDVLPKCRDVLVKNMLSTPSETSASRNGSATHAVGVETVRSSLPVPSNVVIRMFTIDSPFARIAVAIREGQHALGQSHQVRLGVID